MKVWHVFRTDGAIGYDEYDGHIVVADTQEEVVNILNEHFGKNVLIFGWWADGSGKAMWKMKEITEPGVVLSSFNAG